MDNEHSEKAETENRQKCERAEPFEVENCSKRECERERAETYAAKKEFADIETKEFENLSAREKIKHVQNIIAEILYEIDYIKLQENPRIEADYATKIGYLENDLLKTQIEARRKKRAYTLAQARINAGESVDVEQIQAQLDSEFEEWQEKLSQAIERFISIAERMAGSKVVSPIQAREIKRIHKILVKRLHPDLHPLQGGDEKRLFAIAQSAYENGDIDLLKSLEVTSRWIDEEDNIDAQTEIEQQAEFEVLLAQMRTCEQQLTALKNSLPYCMKEKLENTKWVMEKTEKLKDEIEQQEQVAAEYERRCKELLGDAGAKR